MRDERARANARAVAGSAINLPRRLATALAVDAAGRGASGKEARKVR